MKADYQKIYDMVDWYGRGLRSPGLRLLDLYEKYLYNQVIDYGCGRGVLVEELRARGCRAYGFDVVDNDSEYCFSDFGAIPYDCLKKTSLVCCDVLEHLNIKEIKHILKIPADNYIISVNNAESKCPLTGGELHISRFSFKKWGEIIGQKIDIIDNYEIDEKQILFIGNPK